MSNEEKRILELERKVDWLYEMLAKQTKVNGKLIDGLGGLTNAVQTNTGILEFHTKILHDLTEIMTED